MSLSLDLVQDAVGYRFTDTELLERALVHRSHLAEAKGSERSYERLEFLGDAVLQLVVTEHLFTDHPELPEGQMAKIRASAVDEQTLSAMSSRFGIGEAVALGRGEVVTGGRKKPSILADALEAIIGAVFLDGGWEAVRRLVRAHWMPVIAERVRQPGGGDYKTRLQELAQARGWDLGYRVEGSGPDHARAFAAEAIIDGRVVGRGAGTSKKRAEQEAARAALVAVT